MRKLGMWGGPVLATMLIVVGVTGLTTGPALAQDRAVPWLGVTTQSLDDGLREGLDYRGEGVLVSQVVGDSPAFRAGIRKGDILVSVNSRSVGSPRELSDVVRGARIGQSASIVLVRNGQRRTVSARLAERPEDAETPDMDMEGFHDMRDLPRHMERDLGPMKEWHSEGGDPGTFVFRGMGRGRLGVRIDDLNDDLGSYFSVPDGKGALIVEVLKDTPAEKAGLKAGDVITQVGDRKIAGSDDLVEALQDSPKGNISITVMRKGARRSFQTELEDAPRSMRFGPGRDMTMLHPRTNGREAVPDVRGGVRRDSGDSSDELRELREEVRQLREKLNQLEDDHN